MLINEIVKISVNKLKRNKERKNFTKNSRKKIYQKFWVMLRKIPEGRYLIMDKKGPFLPPGVKIPKLSKVFTSHSQEILIDPNIQILRSIRPFCESSLCLSENKFIAFMEGISFFFKRHKTCLISLRGLIQVHTYFCLGPEPIGNSMFSCFT